jgi:hypothetical protein
MHDETMLKYETINSSFKTRLAATAAAASSIEQTLHDTAIIDDNENNAAHELKIDDLKPSSGFWPQLKTLLWKNLLLIRRNYIQFSIEISLSLFFVFSLLIVRNFVERIFYAELPNSIYNVVDFFYKYIGTDTIMFYPDTPVVRNIIDRAVRFIKAQKYWLTLHGK